MPTIQIDIATAAQANRVLDAFAAVYRYDTEKLPGETRAQFAKRKVAEYIRHVVRRHQTETAAEAARVAAVAAAEADAAGIS